MKTALYSIYNFFESIGRARAAAEFARLGRYDMAKKVMENDSAKFEVHP